MYEVSLVNSTTNIEENLGWETGQTKPALVALYNIRPENGAGLFLQTRSPHGATQAGGTTEQHVIIGFGVD